MIKLSEACIWKETSVLAASLCAYYAIGWQSLKLPNMICYTYV